MFPDLEPCRVPRPKILEVAEAMKARADALTEDAANQPGWQAKADQPDPNDNDQIPAGYTYFGQFIDHDVTFDVGSRLDRHAAGLGHAPLNIRTPRLDLDSMYGRGPEAEPHLYRGEALRLGAGADGNPDLLRLPADPGPATAVLPDPRNDENVIVAQIHLALMAKHNAYVDEFSDFQAARAATRLVYQRAVVEDYLPRICGEGIVGDTLRTGARLLPQGLGHFIPIEFSVGAYRFGHSQVRPRYQIVENSGTSHGIFKTDENDPAEGLNGGRPLPGELRINDLGFFFDDTTPQKSRKIDLQLSPGLFGLFGIGDQADLEFPSHDIAQNLAARNLERGVVLGLPSGENIHDELRKRGLIPGHDETVLQAIRDEFWKDVNDPPDCTPLWGFTLAEAALTQDGLRLGLVAGSRAAAAPSSALSPRESAHGADVRACARGPGCPRRPRVCGGSA